MGATRAGSRENVLSFSSPETRTVCLISLCDRIKDRHWVKQNLKWKLYQSFQVIKNIYCFPRWFEMQTWLCGWENKQMPIFLVPTRPMCWAVKGTGTGHPHKVYCLLPYRRYWTSNSTWVSLAFTKPWAEVGSLLLKQQSFVVAFKIK